MRRVAAGNLSLMDADTHNIRRLVSGPAMPDHTGFTRLPIRTMQNSLALRPAQRREKDPGLMTSQLRAFSEKKREVRK